MSATARSIKNIINELEFLRDEKVINESEFSQITGILNKTGAPASAPAANANANGEVFVARYDFAGHEPTDLSLKTGDRIKVTGRPSNDWWRGVIVGTDREGTFPSNYVVPDSNEKSSYNAPTDRPVSQNSQQAPPPSYYGQSQYPQGGSQGGPQPFQQQQQYYPPPQQQQYGGPPQQQNYQPPFYPQQQQQQQQQPQQQQEPQQQQQQHQHGQMGEYAKKFGSRFGNAALWGAGATLGSDLINSIL